MSYFVKFVKFLSFDDSIAWCQVSDSGALRPAIMLYQDGIFSIPKKNSLVEVRKTEDGDYLYLINSRSNTNIINIDNDKKIITINNCTGYTISVDGDINIDCKNAVLKADNIDLGNTGGGLVLTVDDSLIIPAGTTLMTISPSAGSPIINDLPISIDITTTTTITKAK